MKSKYKVVNQKRSDKIQNQEQFYKEVQQIRRKRLAFFTRLGTICLSAYFIATAGVIQNKNDGGAGIQTTGMEQVQNQNTEIKLQSMKDPNIKEEDLIELLEMGELKEEVELLTEFEEVDQLQQIFQKYCAIYQVKEDIVYQKAKELTQDFTDVDWLENNNIKGTKLIKQQRSYASQELGILAFVRHIKQLPSDFGYSMEEISSQVPYQLENSYEEFTKNICSLLEYTDPILCQAIQRHETEHYTSDNFYSKNNVAGIRNSEGNFWTFDNVGESIIEQALQLEYKYFIDSECRNFSTMEEKIIHIQQIYCPLDDETDVNKNNQYWVQSVTDLYHQLQPSYQDQPTKNSI